MSDLLNSASLVMIPSGYKEDVVYSQIPTDGSGDLSFTRASNGTRVNSAGLVEVCPWNIVQQSETFDNAIWNLYYGTITSNSQTAPNGTLTADTLNSTTQQYSGIYQSLGTLPTNVYTYSIYVKAGTNTFFGMLGQGTGSQIAIFNLSTGVVSSTSNLDSASIENVGNGWFRCQIQKTGAGVEMLIFSSNIANSTPTASGTVFIWGAQLNIGATAKPYFPTTDRLNVPRLTYQNGGGGCPSLLLEKQSTNLVTYSEQFDNAAYSSANVNGTVTITANYGTSPDATQNADRVQLTRGTSAGNYAQFYQVVSATNAATYTFSCWMKSLSGTPTIGWAYNGSTWDVVTLTTEWVRYTWTTTTSATPSVNLIIYTDLPTTSTSADFLVWGYQIEQSSYPTSYIPTTSASATRVADVCSKTGISSLIGQTEGVLFADFVANSAETTIIAINDPANPSTNIIYIQAQIGDVWRAYVVNGGVYQVAITAGSGATGRCKMAFAYKQNDFVLYANGQLILADSSGTVPACSAFYLGYYNGIYTPIQTNQAILFKTRLTNAELASLTTI